MTSNHHVRDGRSRKAHYSALGVIMGIVVEAIEGERAIPGSDRRPRVTTWCLAPGGILACLCD